jgi:hypothetical protein
MGAANNAGNIKCDGIGVVNFAAVNINGTRVSEHTQTVLEELTANGVDGRRWRRRFEQYEPFMMETVADGPSRVAGEAEANLYEDLSGEYVTLTLTIAGVTRSWKNVKVYGGVNIDLKAGRLTGTNVDASSSYVLYGRWKLCLTEAAS